VLELQKPDPRSITVTSVALSRVVGATDCTSGGDVGAAKSIPDERIMTTNIRPACILLFMESLLNVHHS
jgi:hypothetical protein